MEAIAPRPVVHLTDTVLVQPQTLESGASVSGQACVTSIRSVQLGYLFTGSMRDGQVDNTVLVQLKPSKVDDRSSGKCNLVHIVCQVNQV